jgi:hypothetical protein
MSVVKKSSLLLIIYPYESSLSPYSDGGTMFIFYYTIMHYNTFLHSDVVQAPRYYTIIRYNTTNSGFIIHPPELNLQRKEGSSYTIVL